MVRLRREVFFIINNIKFIIERERPHCWRKVFFVERCGGAFLIEELMVLTGNWRWRHQRFIYILILGDFLGTQSQSWIRRNFRDFVNPPPSNFANRNWSQSWKSTVFSQAKCKTVLALSAPARPHRVATNFKCFSPPILKKRRVTQFHSSCQICYVSHI